MDVNNQVIIKLNLKELEQMKAKINGIQIKKLHKNQVDIVTDKNRYYNSLLDKQAEDSYYSNIDIYNTPPSMLFTLLHEKLKSTHQKQLPYYLSKDQFLYTWVDLQPDGTITSIYSGERRDPYELIAGDNETIERRYIQFKNLLENYTDVRNNYSSIIQKIMMDNKFNTEHVVPQSWYQAKEPMKGDLHHLFACQPFCNAKRSNYPYFDFPNYTPESPNEEIQNRCGVSYLERFEPEYGKGAVARAMLYFLVRYPNTISRRFLRKVDTKLLIRWHLQFPVTLYEKHRNRSIYLIQGNRNPFIDFPELARLIDFNI